MSEQYNWNNTYSAKQETHKGILGILNQFFLSYTFRYQLRMFIIEKITVHTSEDK